MEATSELEAPPTVKIVQNDTNCSNKEIVEKKNTRNNIYIYIIFGLLILSFSIYLGSKCTFKFFIYLKKLMESNSSGKLIDNNTEKNNGIIQLNTTYKNGDILINKDLINSVKSFIACIGRYGEGKSTFASNFYKLLYNVKNDYFESKKTGRTFTKGIWMISEKERGRLGKYIDKEILDVEGFGINNTDTHKYILIVSFLSNRVVILNISHRDEEIIEIIKIIEKGLKEMQKREIPRILKVIYIQTIYANHAPIENLLNSFDYDINIFKEIEFKYFYLPNIPPEIKENKELLEIGYYKEAFVNFLNLLNVKDKNDSYDSVSSLKKHIDEFNRILNGNGLFKSQNMKEDIEVNFNSIYLKKREKKKEELLQKKLKPLENINETFEDFIKKQNLSFEFEIKNKEFQFYGSSPVYNNYYDNLRKNKTFKIESNIFLNFYNAEKLRLDSELKMIEAEIDNIFATKKKAIINYFEFLKFKEKIEENMDLKINIKTKQSIINYKLEREKNLEDLFKEKKKEKEKEWEERILRAKNNVEDDFNNIYLEKKEKKIKELLQKKLKPLENTNETFEDFIKKQNLSFEFEIKNEEFQFYGNNPDYNNYYDNLRKNKTFKIESKDIFLDSYIAQKRELGLKKINNIFDEKKKQINNYFNSLKFKEEIEENMDLKINIKSEQNLNNYKLEREKYLDDLFKEKKKEKEKEWDEKIEKSKWKFPVQDYEKMICKNGHKLVPEVSCSICHENLYWVDMKEKYVICKGCNRVKKLSEKSFCRTCGAEAISEEEYEKNYKPKQGFLCKHLNIFC